MENDYLLQPISVKLTDRLPKTGFPRPALYCKPELSLPLYFQEARGSALPSDTSIPPANTVLELPGSHPAQASAEPAAENRAVCSLSWS